MFRNAISKSLRPKRFYSQMAYESLKTGRAAFLTRKYTVAFASSTTAAILLWYLSDNVVHNDSGNILAPQVKPVAPKTANSTGVSQDGTICAVVWGSNKSNLIHPASPRIETVQVPENAKWLENVALRDLALHERHAACVDARGDVYQWGDEFFSSTPGARTESKTPKLTLRGKNIVRLQLTDSRVYALSASGRIYVFAANEEQQKLPTAMLPTAGISWWRTCLIWGEDQATIDFTEISPKDKLHWGETFLSIAAGCNHLLALTSEGRTFTHPMNKNANSRGQLGLRKFDIPVPPSSTGALSPSRISVELVPQSVADPFAKTSPFSRDSTHVHAASVSENLNTIDDQHIRFCDTLYEIPSLRGVKVSQIAAGGRNSFVNTESGRVLGWGANEYGQIGLGSGITLDAITVPTEIILTRNVPASTASRCLGIAAGGDLTCFVAERTAKDSLTYVDVLTCGNGQWGGLGNNLFSTAQGNPVRVKNVSGLREFDEHSQTLLPIVPQAISVSPTGHVLLTLDTSSRAGPGGSGQDIAAWGLNHDYQLGTGKRTSLNTPVTLERPEGGRFILAKRKARVNDLSGKVWKKNVEVEQCAVAGYGNSIVYWKTRL
ncbi:regulator of chromosome condensation 1/beta-lactamase-inhibitor protein II [Melanogaster broomeanus]|nr:regulator of chromosome condensation 1/beta-lactamase-inhibitor protein II [Melanogaster broomeanus]